MLDPTVLASVPLFQLFDEQECSTLAALLETRRHVTGDVVCLQGEPGHELLIVRSGRVQVFTVLGNAINCTHAHRGRG